MAKEVKVLVACGSGVATSTIAQEEIKEIAQSDINRKLDALIQSGAVIRENHIEYELFDDHLKAGGYVTADVPAGT